MITTNYYSRSRTAITRDLRSGDITPQRARMLRSLLGLAEERGLYLPNETVTTDWLGLGQLIIAMDEFPGTDGHNGPYFFAFDVLKVAATGMDVYTRLRAEEDEEAAETGKASRYCDYEVPLDGGAVKWVPLCSWQMALELTLEGAWGAEIFNNMQPLFRLAAVESGIADQLGGVIRQASDGTWVEAGKTLADVIAADGVPTVEEVREAVHRGPHLPEGGDRD